MFAAALLYILFAQNKRALYIKCITLQVNDMESVKKGLPGNSSPCTVAGRENCYIVMADRWLPGYKVDGRIADLFTRVIGSSYEPEKYQATDEERREIWSCTHKKISYTEIKRGKQGITLWEKYSM